MKILTISIAVFIAFSTISLAVNPPALPNTSTVITCFPDTSGYKTITVGAVGRDYTDLQKAINTADLGTIIKLDAGATFNGGFVLPKKTIGSGWIVIMSSRMDVLPKA